MAEPLTQAELDELRRITPRATIDSIGATPTDEASPEFIADLTAYLSRYAAPARDEDGKPKEGHPCLRCGRGGFEWGLAHGHGHCRNCGWPATLYHFIKDRNGEDLLTIRNVLLQVHPDNVEIRKKDAA